MHCRFLYDETLTQIQFFIVSPSGATTTKHPKNCINSYDFITDRARKNSFKHKRKTEKKSCDINFFQKSKENKIYHNYSSKTEQTVLKNSVIFVLPMRQINYRNSAVEGTNGGNLRNKIYSSFKIYMTG